MASTKFGRPAEACHVFGTVLILIAFFSWMPSCFEVPPSEESQSSASHVAADGLTQGMVVEEGAPGRQASALNAAAELEAHSKKQEGETSCQDQVNETAHDMPRAMPFLVALIAGGALSLEAFKGFPML